MRTVFAVAAFAFLPVAALAQPVAPPPIAPPAPAPLPPSQVAPPGVEPPFLRPGKEVSQPLTPVGPAPALVPVELPPLLTVPELKPEPKPEVKPVAAEHPRGPRGPGWSSAELLYWWPMRQPIPPLVSGTRTGLPPLFGDGSTSLLVGGRALDSQPHAGGRFTLGSSLDTAETFGYEVTYLFLGTRTLSERVTDLNGSRVRSFGLPYTNATTSPAEYLTLAQPGTNSSLFVTSAATRVQGWEVNTVANVLDEKCVKINALAGWRYFQVHEGLRLEQTQLRFADMPGVVRTADQFDAHNRFHGGQLGLHADARRGAVFCEMTAKVAFGQNYEVVKNEGMTILQSPVLGGTATRAFGGSGIYVQPSNAGRSANGVFAVVPEGTVKFGFRLGDLGRVYFGYSFIYLSDAVRPGDQIDRTLNPGQVPLMSGTGPVYTADRPARVVNRSDFWAQGLIIGLETRY